MSKQANNKIAVKPIWVSDIKPLTVEGEVISWEVDVRFEGDLASWHNENPLPRTLQDFAKRFNLTDEKMEEIEDDPVNGGHTSIGKMFYEYKQSMGFLYSTEVPYILKQKLDIPYRDDMWNVMWDSESVNGDNKYANTLAVYYFRKKFMDFGYIRARNLRKKMLKQISDRTK